MYLSFLMRLCLACLFVLAVFAAPAFAADPLPALQHDDVVLFQGDSITDGGRQRTGHDFNHIMGQDYGYVIAAKIGAAFPERSITFVNRGISGNRVTDLAARWQTDTLDLKPTVLSILIGINDLMGGVPAGETAEQYEQVYDHLLADTRAALPGVRILLGEPFLLPVGRQKADYAANRAALTHYQEAVRRLGEKYHLPIVPYQSLFDAAMRKAPAEHWSWDGVHPTYAGHGLMAEAWLNTLNQWQSAQATQTAPKGP